MEAIVLYECNGSEMYCLGTEWEKVKRNLRGIVDYMVFPLKSKNSLAISEKVKEIQEGKACPVKGGHFNAH